ncbi:hypothetical protein SAMN05216316_0890 [Nitrosovibrio sp. Nv6]|nr:hypothetical protein SAMN05216316_0890 [Nitrosovibrio sp. Nv6]
MLAEDYANPDGMIYGKFIFYIIARPAPATKTRKILISKAPVECPR